MKKSSEILEERQSLLRDPIQSPYLHFLFSRYLSELQLPAVLHRKVSSRWPNFQIVLYLSILAHFYLSNIHVAHPPGSVTLKKPQRHKATKV